MTTNQHRDTNLEDDGLPGERAQGDADSTVGTGDTEGLSAEAEATDESVEELADAGQDVEAGIVLGVEDAADHPERPVPDHEVDRRPPGPQKERTTL